jgi:hypothetical protein
MYGTKQLILVGIRRFVSGVLTTPAAVIQHGVTTADVDLYAELQHLGFQVMLRSGSFG